MIITIQELAGCEPSIFEGDVTEKLSQNPMHEDFSSARIDPFTGVEPGYFPGRSYYTFYVDGGPDGWERWEARAYVREVKRYELVEWKR